MKELLLQPQDVLFFRDGRPMSGSLAGHGAAWPLPTVLNAALHAALHRAFVDQTTGDNSHRVGRSHAKASIKEGRREYDENEIRHFTDIWSAGPFPVKDGKWFFPRPADAQFKDEKAETTAVTLLPACNDQHGRWANSNLPTPLRYAVANTRDPSKAHLAPWWSAAAFDSYLAGTVVPLKHPDLASDRDFFAAEHNVGIAIDPATQTTGHGAAEGKIYSAHYLRLVDKVQLGALAGDTSGSDATLAALFPATKVPAAKVIIVGGQQRLCTVQCDRVEPDHTRLPKGITSATNLKQCSDGRKYLVKWIMLTPAIWPAISDKKKDGTAQDPHPGGWLPNWVFLGWDSRAQKERPSPRDGEVLLTAGFGTRKAERKNSQAGSTIPARLVAALVPKPLPVTGWALGGYGNGDLGGAKSTHLAVPAGAVYYFEVDRSEGHSPERHAKDLLNALNWHGAGDGTEIKNRRSTLFGEKGFGLGICGTWNFYENVR